MRFLLLLTLCASLSAFDYRVAHELLDDYPFEGDERVLHIGCEEGAITASIATRVPDGFVLGIDPWADHIEAAEQTYDLDLFANIQFQLGITVDGPTQFDLATCFGELDLPALESLRPGGRLLSCVTLEEAADHLAALQEAGLKLTHLAQIDQHLLRVEAERPT